MEINYKDAGDSMVTKVVTTEKMDDFILSYVTSGVMSLDIPVLKMGKVDVSAKYRRPSGVEVRLVDRLVSDIIGETSPNNQELAQIRNTAYLAAHLIGYGDKSFYVETSDEDKYYKSLMERYRWIESLPINIRTGLMNRQQYFVALCGEAFKLSNLENF